MPFEWDLSNVIQIKSNETNTLINNTIYVRKLDIWGNQIDIYYATLLGKSNTIINGTRVEDGKSVLVYDGLDYLFSRENKLNEIVGSGIFEDFASKYWMMCEVNTKRDENNINPEDYKDVKKYVYILSFYDGIDTCQHMLSENVINLNDDKLKNFKQEAEEHGGRLIITKYLIHYQSDKDIKSTNYRLCYMMDSNDNLIITRVIRATDENEFKTYGKYHYDVSGPIQPDILYEDGLMNA